MKSATGVESATPIVNRSGKDQSVPEPISMYIITEIIDTIPSARDVIPIVLLTSVPVAI